MTFAELVINARYRLQDVYTPTGSVITDATSDGIRWSSNRLQTVCKSAIYEMQRSLLADKKTRGNVNLGAFIRRTTGKSISSVDGEIDFTSADLAEISRVLALAEAADESAIYEWVEPKDFIQKKYYTNASPILSEKIFTDLYDETAKRTSYFCLPIPSSNTTVDIILEYSISSFFSTSSVDNLPFVGVDDLLLDFVEKQARREERDVESLKLLILDIDKKIREIRGDIQKSNR